MAHFAKGYTANSKEELDEKIKVAKNGTFNYLSTLGVLPKEITITNGDIYYHLDNGMIGTTIDINLGYFMLSSSSFEQQNEIVKTMHDQTHHLERLKKKINSAIAFSHVAKYDIQNNIVKYIKANITAQTEEELIAKTKQSIWDLVKESDTSIPTELKINSIDFFQTPDGQFTACYTYQIRRDKKVENPHFVKHKAPSPNTDKGRDD